MSLDGRTALVTGAARGIGLAIADVTRTGDVERAVRQAWDLGGRSDPLLPRAAPR